MELGVRVAYPEHGGYDWYEALKPYSAVEMAFRDPEWFIAKGLERIFFQWKANESSLPKILSVHLPHVRITHPHELSAVLLRITQVSPFLHEKPLVIHPTNASLKDGLATLNNVLQAYSAVLRWRSMPLCWETFLSKRRFVNTIESIAGAGLYACYDTSHMRRDTNRVLEDFEKYKDNIKVVHLSNWDEDNRQHLPLREGTIDMRKVLRWLDKYFDGPVILEYLPEYHHLYLEDLRWAREKVLK